MVKEGSLYVAFVMYPLNVDYSPLFFLQCIVTCYEFAINVKHRLDCPTLSQKRVS